jgi:hypothetical protein
MADQRGRLVEFIAKLNRMTQEGRIKWQLYQPPEYLTSGTDDIYPFFWGAKVDDKKLGLYVQRHITSDFFRINKYWEEKTVLAFCQDDWTPVWEFPQIAGINELRSSVERQSVGVDSFIDRLLSEENN